MEDCATNELQFETPTSLALEAAFDGGRLTSDGGLLWLSEVDKDLGLCEAMAKHVPEWRKREGHHSLMTLFKQRVYQIACGYEDQNDSNTLREDPLLKLVCGSLPESAQKLASQPTISRFENAVSARGCYLMAEALFELYLRERAKNGAPKKILLDLDATDDPTHGDQEGAYYHGYYQEHILHPLLVFDGNTGQLITAVLRLSLTFGDRGSSRVMSRLLGAACTSLATVCEQLRPHFEAAATAFRALLPHVGARSALLHQKLGRARCSSYSPGIFWRDLPRAAAFLPLPPIRR
jgi:hypothetical protein